MDMQKTTITKRIFSIHYLSIIIGFLFITDMSVILDIPILRQVSVFLCLTILPGFLIVHTLHLIKSDFFIKFLFSVGLSIAILTFSGLLLNSVLPFTGIVTPISITPLIITVNAIILLLCILCYRFNREPIFIGINVKAALSQPILLLSLLPLMTYLGAYLIRYHNNNSLLLSMIILVAIIVSLIASDKVIPKRLYPLAIYMISTALLFQFPLVTLNLTGTDILVEYYFQHLAEVNSYWAPNIASMTNSMPIITIWPTIYSILMNVDGTWLFKIAFCFLFSLLPLGLYYTYSSQIGEKRAFLATFLYMSFSYFLIGRTNLAKELTAELFIVLILTSIFSMGIDKYKQKALMIVFGTMVVISHYSTSYLFMFFIVFVYALLFFAQKNSERTITGVWVVLFVITALSWYMYIANSVTFIESINILDHIATSIKTELLVPEARSDSALTVLGFHSGISQTIGHRIYTWLFRVIQFLLVIGIIRLIWDFIRSRQEMKIKPEFFAFTFTGLVLLALCLILPSFNATFNIDRTYGFALIFIVPLSIFGIETLFTGISKIFKCNLTEKKVLCIFTLLILVPNLLFNTGFLYEVTGDDPAYSIVLSKKSMENCNDIRCKLNYYGYILSDEDVGGIRWLSSCIADKKKVYVGRWYQYPVMAYGMIPLGRLPLLKDNKLIIEDSYIYLGSGNVRGNIWVPGTWGERTRDVFEFEELIPLLKKGNKIYSNGGSEIYQYG